MNINEKFEYITEHTSVDYCLLKTAEEMFELGEVIMKQITKPNGADNPERLAKIIEESGDVIMNVKGLAIKLGILPEVMDRVTYKLDKCVERVDKQLKDDIR